MNAIMTNDNEALHPLDRMVSRTDFTDEEFYQAVREKFGARGVREAKEYIEKHVPPPNKNLSPVFCPLCGRLYPPL